MVESVQKPMCYLNGKMLTDNKSLFKRTLKKNYVKIFS
jgi:hypothetical protein